MLLPSSKAGRLVVGEVMFTELSRSVYNNFIITLFATTLKDQVSKVKLVSFSQYKFLQLRSPPLILTLNVKSMRCLRAFNRGGSPSVGVSVYGSLEHHKFQNYSCMSPANGLFLLLLRNHEQLWLYFYIL